jgi:type II secretory pathway component PulF
MADSTIPESRFLLRRHPALPAVARAVLLCGAWLPFVGLLLLLLPRYDPIFARLEEKGELPALTGWLYALGQLNAATFGLPIVGLFVLLVLADLAVARLGRDSRRGRRIYWVWFALMLLLAGLACVLFFVGVLAPVFKMGSTVG